jgi:hypothetical protein
LILAHFPNTFHVGFNVAVLFFNPFSATFLFSSERRLPVRPPPRQGFISLITASKLSTNTQTPCPDLHRQAGPTEGTFLLFRSVFAKNASWCPLAARARHNLFFCFQQHQNINPGYEFKIKEKSARGHVCGPYFQAKCEIHSNTNIFSWF